MDFFVKRACWYTIVRYDDWQNTDEKFRFYNLIVIENGLYVTKMGVKTSTGQLILSVQQSS